MKQDARTLPVERLARIAALIGGISRPFRLLPEEMLRNTATPREVMELILTDEEKIFMIQGRMELM